jgi:hypothetical protein
MGDQHAVQVFYAYLGHLERTYRRCLASLASVLLMLPLMVHWEHLLFGTTCIIHSMVRTLVLGRWYRHCHS